MSNRIRRLEMDDLRPDLSDRLRARVARLGYLGEFFKCMGHQPDALIAFHQFTESAKEGLDKRMVELIALTVASIVGNAYERNQHERLSVRSGFGREWVKAVECLEPATEGLTDEERTVQRFVIAAVASNGRGAASQFEDVVDAIGPTSALAVLFVIGRYLMHGLVVNTLELAPPVPSIFEDGFSG
jgi:alkylhydroperoxidase family enzyme